MPLRKLLALKLAFVLLLGALAPGIAAQTQTSTPARPTRTATATPAASCENGECVERLIQRLEDLGGAYQRQCLPSEGNRPADLRTWHAENGLSEQCWQLMTEINHLEAELQRHEAGLQERLGCESGECRLAIQGQGLNAQLTQLTRVEQNLACTEPKKREIQSKCGEELSCVLVASALGIGGYVAERMLPERARPRNCHLGDDSCVTQLATGFLRAAVNFFEGAWDLLKMAGRAAGRAVGNFWTWVRGGEDHAATAQLAMARASEDPGIFQELLRDFPGTMGKVWSAFMASIKEWLKKDIFCQRWSGVPRFSNCVTPTESFDCISCKAMATGLCAVSGTIVAEIVPAFLAGGLVTAVAQGARGAARLARLYRVSDQSARTVRQSRIAQLASEAGGRVDEALRLSRGLRTAKAAVEGALRSIRTYLLSPLRRAVKESMTALTEAVRRGGAAIAITPSRRMLAFPGQMLRTAGRIVIYPIENPMTVFAFRSGQRTFERAFRLTTPQLARPAGAAALLISQDQAAGTLLARIEEARGNQARAADLLKLEQELLAKVEPRRRNLVAEALAKSEGDLNDVLRTLYPELQYGDLAKGLDRAKVLGAERELALAIEALPESPLRADLLRKFQQHVAQEARTRLVGVNTPNYEQVITNSRLPEDRRLAEALELTRRTPASAEEREKLARALRDAHLVAPDNGVFEYSWRELREKYRILTAGGFSADEAEALIRAGLAGRPPVRELIQPGQTLFSGFAEDLLDRNYLERRAELQRLVRERSGTPASAARTIDNLESLYFSDYVHQVDELSNIMNGGQRLATSGLARTYETPAFRNFRATREHLLEARPPMNRQTFLDVHRRMMRGGVEDVADADLGTIRESSLYFNVPSGSAITDAVRREIQANPYLVWVEKGQNRTGNFYGETWYPNAEIVKKEGLDIIRGSRPALVREIEEYQGLAAQVRRTTERAQELRRAGNTAEARRVSQELAELKRRHAALSARSEELTRGLVEAMVDERMEWFTRQRTLLGELDSPEKLDEYVNLVARFQRDLVSIHPLPDGNGRTTREFALAYALMREGFPPPRILDPDADVYRSLDDWRRIIKHGILSSDFLVADLTERLRFNLPLENSLDLVTPYTRPPVPMALRGDRATTQMEGVEYIDPRFYREVARQEIARNPALRRELETNPIQAWDRIHQRAREVHARNNVYYRHPKNGVERVAVNYVDEDFRTLYGRPSFHDRELFDFKLRTWYSNDLTWRGLASTDRATSEADIVKMFSQLTTHNASNAVLGRVRGPSPDAIRRAALEDFDNYNRDVFGDGLVRMARDHSETGPLYDQSYGYSTSKNREVGKAFAMGAMVVGDYGAHRTPELQALLQSRVLVGARRANHDVDLGRLRQVREDFSYRYGRQQEVMGIGAGDPDAVTIVQTIDDKGEVLLTYLRNRENPAEIFVIRGNVDPDAVPPRDRIERTIRLGN